jgi:hypothetical protein
MLLACASATADAWFHGSADFLDTVFLRTYTYKTISRYKVVGADPTDIDIYYIFRLGTRIFVAPNGTLLQIMERRI